MDNAFTNMPVNRGIGFLLKSLVTKGNRAMDYAKEKEIDCFFKAVECAKQDLDSVQRLLDSTADPDIIEYAIYQERAASLRLSYLIKKAKERNIRATMKGAEFSDI